MTLDTFISLAIAAAGLIMAYLGVHLTFHPANSTWKQRIFKTVFGIMAVATCGLVAWQATRSNDSQRATVDQLKTAIAETERSLSEAQANSEQRLHRQQLQDAAQLRYLLARLTVPASKPTIQLDNSPLSGQARALRSLSNVRLRQLALERASAIDRRLARYNETSNALSREHVTAVERVVMTGHPTPDEIRKQEETSYLIEHLFEGAEYPTRTLPTQREREDASMIELKKITESYIAREVQNLQSLITDYRSEHAIATMTLEAEISARLRAEPEAVNVDRFAEPLTAAYISAIAADLKRSAALLPAVR